MLGVVKRAVQHRCPFCDKPFLKAEAMQMHQHSKHGAPMPEKAIDPCCIECGKVASLVTGERIYPHRPDLYAKSFWLCECGAYCGCHGTTDRPLGYPCGAETRVARQAAHAAFDPLWKSRLMRRADAYAWLARQLSIPSGECHIGMMSAEMARRVVVACRELDR